MGNKSPTLGKWREMAVKVFGEDSPQTKYLDKKIAEQGEGSVAAVSDAEMLVILASLPKTQE